MGEKILSEKHNMKKKEKRKRKKKKEKELKQRSKGDRKKDGQSCKTLKPPCHL